MKILKSTLRRVVLEECRFVLEEAASSIDVPEPGMEGPEQKRQKQQQWRTDIEKKLADIQKKLDKSAQISSIRAIKLKDLQQQAQDNEDTIMKMGLAKMHSDAEVRKRQDAEKRASAQRQKKPEKTSLIDRDPDTGKKVARMPAHLRPSRIDEPKPEPDEQPARPVATADERYTGNMRQKLQQFLRKKKKAGE